MKVGELVRFPCDTEKYEYRTGVFLGTHDNKADVTDPVLSTALARAGKKPRQVADILYNGKFTTCWAQHVERINEDR